VAKDYTQKGRETNGDKPVENGVKLGNLGRFGSKQTYYHA
jgi:hypothetical protein